MLSGILKMNIVILGGGGVRANLFIFLSDTRTQPGSLKPIFRECHMLCTVFIHYLSAEHVLIFCYLLHFFREVRLDFVCGRKCCVCLWMAGRFSEFPSFP